MTWDSPTKKVCPQCGGVVYRHYTKEDKRYLCHKPGCGWSEPIASRGKKAAVEGEETKKTTRGRKKAEPEAAESETKPAKRTRKTAAKAETAGKPSKTVKKSAATAKKTVKKAADAAETPKKTTRKKKTEDAE